MLVARSTWVNAGGGEQWHCDTFRRKSHGGVRGPGEPRRPNSVGGASGEWGGGPRRGAPCRQGSRSCLLRSLRGDVGEQSEAGDVIGEQGVGVLKAGVSADDERRRPPAPGVDLQTWTSGRRGGAGRQLGDSARPDTNPSLPPRLPELLPGPGRDDGGGPVIPLPGGPAASRGTCTPARAFLIV